jgi:hypothetical protein
MVDEQDALRPSRPDLSDVALIAEFQGALEHLCKRFGVYFTHEDHQGAGLLYRVPDEETGVDIYITVRK